MDDSDEDSSLSDVELVQPLRSREEVRRRDESSAHDSTGASAHGTPISSSGRESARHSESGELTLQTGPTGDADSSISEADAAQRESGSSTGMPGDSSPHFGHDIPSGTQSSDALSDAEEEEEEDHTFDVDDMRDDIEPEAYYEEDDNDAEEED